MTSISIALAALATATNIARDGTARSWLPESHPSAPCAYVNDGDPLTFWGSNEPTTDPPKDIGILWPQARTFAAVRIKFFSLGYTPAADGWRLEVPGGDGWQALQARVDTTECEWWTLRFPPVTAAAVRLVVTGYRRNRPAVCEFEVYETAPPAPSLRRPALLDGAFWAFGYDHWAQTFATDARLAAEVEVGHRIGLDTLILYTLNGQDGSYSTVAPDTPLPMSAAWRGRDPLEAILSVADRLGVRVYLGDAQPTGWNRPVGDEATEVHAVLDAYRAALIRRYEHHPSFVGYYLNFECCPAEWDNDPTVPARLANDTAELVKRLCPRLVMIQPIGLYQWRDAPDGPWRHVTPPELERFWRPWIAAAPAIDIYLAIDGVGTNLAPLGFTDVNQACLRRLCEEAGKTFWVDVENADFSDYTSMPMARLQASLEVAAQHGEQLVTFCYLNYMSPNNGREGSARLYREYAAYREALGAGAAP